MCKQPKYGIDDGLLSGTHAEKVFGSIISVDFDSDQKVYVYKVL
jgi:hypothetical protein